MEHPLRGSHDKNLRSESEHSARTGELIERTDANTTRSTLKKDGQVVMTVTSVVSNDGKTRTSTFKGKNAKGQGCK